MSDHVTDLASTLDSSHPSQPPADVTMADATQPQPVPPAPTSPVPSAALAPPPSESAPAPSTTEAPVPGPAPPATTPAPPVKRGPGRPKGSSTKNRAVVLIEQRPKRPVGRPRKDGLPAGSLLPPREKKTPGRPRKSAPAGLGGAMAGGHVFPYPGASLSAAAGTSPAWHAGYAATPASAAKARAGAKRIAAAAGAAPALDIDPALTNEWLGLVRAGRSDALLHALLRELDAAPEPVPTAAGSNLDEAFRAHLVSLMPKGKSSPAQAGGVEIPSLYSIMKTFWLPTSPAYFSLTASASTYRRPSAHRFLYWDPQPLVFNGIACPSCAAPLANRGRIKSGPVKVHDLGRPFYVIACEYVCGSDVCRGTSAGGEGRKFASTDVRILRALPAALKSEFPAVLVQSLSPYAASPADADDAPDLGSGPEVWNWRALGVSTALWNLVRGALEMGMGREQIMEIVRFTRNGVPEESSAGMQKQEEEEEEEAVQGGKNINEPAGVFTTWQSGAAPYPSIAQLPQSPASAPAPGATSSPAPPTPATSAQNLSASPVPAAAAVAPPTPVSAGTTTAAPAPQPAYYANGHYPPYGFTYSYYAGAPPAPAAPGDAGGLKRTFAQAAPPPAPGAPGGAPPPAPAAGGTGVAGTLEPPPKRVRRCCKCGSQDCKGKGGRNFCANPCQDCGRMECPGRNSKKAEKTCAEAWL